MNKPYLKEVLAELWNYEHVNDISNFNFKKSEHNNHFYFEDINLTVVEDDIKMKCP